MPIFDFNWDGKTSPSEKFLAYHILQTLHDKTPPACDSCPEQPSEKSAHSGDPHSADHRPAHHPPAAGFVPRICTVLVLGLLLLGLHSYRDQIHMEYEKIRFQIGIHLLEAGKYGRAQDIFYTKMDPDNPYEAIRYDLAAYSVACSYYRHGDLANAALYLDQPVMDTVNALEIDGRSELFQAVQEYRRRSCEPAPIAESASDLRCPYVGMPESLIAETGLGKPSRQIRHDLEWIDGVWHQANLYDFKRGNRVYFTARCVRGVVTQVWDHRPTPVP